MSNLCNEQGIKNLVHISALGVKEKHNSLYMQSKLEGEKNIQDTFKPSVILRPSVVFGPEDKFFNTFASLAQFSPILPLSSSLLLSAPASCLHSVHLEECILPAELLLFSFWPEVLGDWSRARAFVNDACFY